MRIALDATYSLGRNLSGVGVYSHELLFQLAVLRPDFEWRWLYRPHRFLRSLKEQLPVNAGRGLLFDNPPLRVLPFFHGLNQRLPAKRFPRQVATFHDLFVMTADYSTPEFRSRFAAQAKHAAKEADHIIAVSEFTARQVIDLLGVERARVTVIPHGVRPLPAVSAPKENVILHVGAVQKRKNLVRLVHAFRAVGPEWRLVLAGSAGYGADEVMRAIEESPCRNRITVTGYVSPEELARWYAVARVFAFPSLDEGFGMPVLEAMAAGVPVMAANSSAVGEVTEDAALRVDPEREDEIANGLRTLTTDCSYVEELVNRGKKRADGFTWERAARATLAVYAELFTLGAFTLRP